MRLRQTLVQAVATQSPSATSHGIVVDTRGIWYDHSIGDSRALLLWHHKFTDVHGRTVVNTNGHA